MDWLDDLIDNEKPTFLHVWATVLSKFVGGLKAFIGRKVNAVFENEITYVILAFLIPITIMTGIFLFVKTCIDVKEERAVQEQKERCQEWGEVYQVKTNWLEVSQECLFKREHKIFTIDVDKYSHGDVTLKYVENEFL